jgi:hypothetical protein
MLSLRDISPLSFNRVSSLSDQELRIAIAREVIGWENVRLERSGRILADSSRVMTTFPVIVPDWVNDESHISCLELEARRRGWLLTYQRELGKIAGDFNTKPTARQRCEAILLTARMSPMERI